MLFKFNKIDYKGVSFEFKISSLVKENQVVYIVGFDPDKERRVFFMREIYLKPLESKTKYKLPCPITSKKVNILVFNDKEENSSTSAFFKIEGMSANYLGYKPKFLDARTNRYVNFILPFCYNYDDLKNGWYKSKEGEFRILNRQKIVEDKTPSRISMDDNHIEVSYEDFKDLPIPRRFIILCHEYSHNYLNKDINNESEADINGLKIYLACNFPVIESVYAFTKILSDDEEGRMRINNIINYLESHNSSFNLFKNYDDNRKEYSDIFYSFNFSV